MITPGVPPGVEFCTPSYKGQETIYILLNSPSVRVGGFHEFFFFKMRKNPLPSDFFRPKMADLSSPMGRTPNGNPDRGFGAEGCLGGGALAPSPIFPKFDKKLRTNTIFTYFHEGVGPPQFFRRPLPTFFRRPPRTALFWG